MKILNLALKYPKCIMSPKILLLNSFRIIICLFTYSSNFSNPYMYYDAVVQTKEFFFFFKEIGLGPNSTLKASSRGEDFPSHIKRPPIPFTSNVRLLHPPPSPWTKHLERGQFNMWIQIGKQDLGWSSLIPC